MQKNEQMSQKTIRASIIRSLKKEGLWNTALEWQVQSLAASVAAVNLAAEEISHLKSTYVKEESRYGEKLVPHPALIVLQKYQSAITSQMKALGLTAADLAMDEDADPMVDLTKLVIESGEETLMPEDD